LTADRGAGAADRADTADRGAEFEYRARDPVAQSRATALQQGHARGIVDYRWGTNEQEPMQALATELLALR
jgi:hypothetical protein